MHNTKIILKDGRAFEGPIWNWRPVEGWFSLVLDDLEYPDAPGRFYLADLKSGVTKEDRRTAATVGQDVDLLKRARADGWMGGRGSLRVRGTADWFLRPPEGLAVNPKLIEALRQQHRVPRRYYHNFGHVIDVCWKLAEARDLEPLSWKVETFYAALFHDAIYEATRSDNEEQSALLAAVWLRGVVPPDVLDRIQRLIQATAAWVPEEELQRDHATAQAFQIFLDCDRSILGSEPARYAAYVRGLQKEFAFAGPEGWRQGRGTFLRSVLNRVTNGGTIFLSAWGRSRWESAARRNIAEELRR